MRKKYPKKWGTEGWVWVIGRGVPADKFAAKPVGAFVPCFLSQVSLSHSRWVGFKNAPNSPTYFHKLHFPIYPSAKEIWQKYCFQKFHILRFFKKGRLRKNIAGVFSREKNAVKGEKKKGSMCVCVHRRRNKH